MHQLDFFTELRAAEYRYMRQTWWIGNHECRTFMDGETPFLQSREGGEGNWKFYVQSFSTLAADTEGTARVALTGTDTQQQETVDVLIDVNDQLHIAGQTFGRDHWEH